MHTELVRKETLKVYHSDTLTRPSQLHPRIANVSRTVGKTIPMEENAAYGEIVREESDIQTSVTFTDQINEHTAVIKYTCV